MNRVRKQFPDVPGRADYCVCWFRKAHDHLKPGQRAGLVGTNTIRQNYSRIGGLDYIVGNAGTIVEAVSTMKWSGDAVVFVSIVNWIKGNMPGNKRLYIQEGNNPGDGWSFKDLSTIGPSLSFATDVTQATTIQVNAAVGGCYQGQTHGHEGFLLPLEQGQAHITADQKNRDVLFPYLIANELIGRKDSLPTRYVINFDNLDLLSAMQYGDLFPRVEKTVLPDRTAAAEEEKERNEEALRENPRAKIAKDHKNALKRWWQLFRSRTQMVSAIDMLPRYIACGRVTSRPIFEFVSSQIYPNDALMVFPYDDDYSFGILQSGLHWIWFFNRCSTLKGDPRYTSNTVFDSFPWPQKPTLNSVKKVARAAVELRVLRQGLKAGHDMSFRELYRTLELPGASPLKDAHEKLDQAVRNAYAMKKSDDPLTFLLGLNHTVAEREDAGEAVIGPGLPPIVKDKSKFVSEDCIHMPEDHAYRESATGSVGGTCN